MNVTAVGIALAKNVFSVQGADCNCMGSRWLRIVIDMPSQRKARPQSHRRSYTTKSNPSASPFSPLCDSRETSLNALRS